MFVLSNGTALNSIFYRRGATRGHASSYKNLERKTVLWYLNDW